MVLNLGFWKRPQIWLSGLLIVLWFFNIGHVKLLKPDEGRYAEISREMNVTQDYLTPRINGIKYFEKPPLNYWMSALFFQIFGEYEWVARLFSTLCSALCLAAVFFYVKHYWKLEQAINATLILASSPLFVLVGHINTLDMSLTLFLTLAMLSLVTLWRPSLSKKELLVSNLILWTSLALGLLSKGLVMLLLPTLVTITYIIVKRDLSIFRKIFWIRGLILFALISFPWFILMSLRHPDFFEFFFIREHFGRYLSQIHDRYEPMWYFVPILIGGFTPWIFFLFRKKLTPSYLIFWTIAIFSFFSVSSSKLPTYILPIFPSMAILASISIKDFPNLALKFVWAWVSLLSIAGMGASFHYYHHETPFTSLEIFQSFSIKLFFSSLLLFFLCIGLFYYRKKGSFQNQFQILTLSLVTFFQFLFWSYGDFSPSLSGYNVSNKIRPYLDENTIIYSVQGYEHSVPFYLKRKVIIVELSGELDFGLKQKDDNIHWHPLLNSFIDEWTTKHNAVALMSPESYKNLEKLKLPMTKVYEDLRWVVITRDKPNKIYE